MIQSEVPKDKVPPPARTNGQAGPDTKPPAPALPIDLATLSEEMLAAIVVQGHAEIARRLEERRAAALAALRAQAEAAQALGIPLARLKAHLDRKDDAMITAATDGRASDGRNIGGRAVVAPKYRDPKTGATWSGRGNPPKWYADHIAAGGTEEECLIPEGAL